MSSTMPGIEENSCWTPWILILVMALPSRLESRIRRRLLPTVWPKPRSKGSTWNSPKVSVKVSRLQMTRLGSSRPRQRIRITMSPHHLKRSTDRRSAAQQLDDQLRCHGQRDILGGRQAGDAALGRVGAEPVQPFGNRRAAPSARLLGGQLAGVVAVLDLDLVAGADQVAGDVELPAVDQDVPVA